LAIGHVWSLALTIPVVLCDCDVCEYGAATVVTSVYPQVNAEVPVQEPIDGGCVKTL